MILSKPAFNNICSFDFVIKSLKMFYLLYSNLDKSVSLLVFIFQGSLHVSRCFCFHDPDVEDRAALNSYLFSPDLSALKYFVSNLIYFTR